MRVIYKSAFPTLIAITKSTMLPETMLHGTILRNITGS